MSKNYDFVAIGDIVTDAFIRLKDARVNCDINDEECRISLSFGDKVPYEFVEVVRAVGNSSNAAVSAARLGLSSALVTNLGGDLNGKECLDTLKQNNVGIDFAKVHKEKETNYHYVLWYEDDRTILVNHQAYDYQFPEIGTPKWLYLSSLGKTTASYHEQIAEYLETNPGVKMAFQPGTFQMQMGTEALARIYRRAEVFFCNVEEAHRILKLPLGKPVEELMDRIFALGPKIVVITDGPRGAYVFDGKEKWSMPTYPDPKPPYERTGAGDAFASTFTAALALDMSIPQALSWGPINSMSVVQQIGAQRGLLSRKELEKYLAEAPENYKPKLIA